MNRDALPEPIVSRKRSLCPWIGCRDIIERSDIVCVYGPDPEPVHYAHVIHEHIERVRQLDAIISQREQTAARLVNSLQAVAAIDKEWLRDATRELFDR